MTRIILCLYMYWLLSAALPMKLLIWFLMMSINNHPTENAECFVKPSNIIVLVDISVITAYFVFKQSYPYVALCFAGTTKTVYILVTHKGTLAAYGMGAYMSTSGNPNEGDLPHLIPPMREVLRKRNSRPFFCN